MKKVRNTVFSVLGGLVLISGLVSCSNNNSGNQLTNGSSELNPVQKKNIEALTSIKMVETISNVNKVSYARSWSNNTNVDTDYLETTILPTIDTLLNNGSIVSSTVEEVETDYNGTIYHFKETLNYKDHNLKDASYTLIYNKETFVKEERDEKEETSILNGIVIISEEERYAFNALNKVETENNEVEEERYFKINMSETSYVKVEEEFEEERNKTESEFEYTFVNNGKVELNYSISLENKQRYDEIEYEINNTEYEVKKMVKDGEEVYKVEVENDKTDSECVGFYKKVVLEDGTTSFVKVN